MLISSMSFSTILLKLCKPGWTAQWEGEVPLEVEMDSPCGLI